MNDIEHAVEIDRHDVLPVLADDVGIGGEGVAPGNAGIVDEDRDLVGFCRDVRSDGAAGGAIGDVEPEVVRLAAGLDDVGGRCGRRLAIDISSNDLRALAGEAQRDGAADPGAGTGHHSGMILQKSWHGSLPSTAGGT